MNTPDVTIESLRTTVNVLIELIAKKDRYVAMQKEVPEHKEDIADWIQETENSGKLLMDVVMNNAEYFVKKELAGKFLKRVTDMRNRTEVEYFKFKEYDVFELDGEDSIHLPFSTIYGQHLSISYDKLNKKVSEVVYETDGSTKSLTDIDVILGNLNGWVECPEDEFHSVMGHTNYFDNYVPKT